MSNKNIIKQKNLFLVNENIIVAITSFPIQIIAIIIHRAYITQKFINISVSESSWFLFCVTVDVIFMFLLRSMAFF